MTYTIPITSAQHGQRLDKALTELMPDMSRSRIQQLINAGAVSCESVTIADASKKVAAEEIYLLVIPPVVAAIPKAQSIALDVVYEDNMLLVINKPVGLTVHPGAGNPDGTLVNALLAHCGAELSGIGGVARPGIVHRIDKDTSGLLIVAKNDEAHRALAAQLENRSLSRRYVAMAWGLLNPTSGTVDAPIARDAKHRQRMCVAAGGKDAITHYQLLRAYGTLASLVECKLQTGRTHQIRVHMKHLGHPLIGDSVYAGQRKLHLARQHDALAAALREFPRQALHAKALAFIHPTSGKAMEFECDMPEDMTALQQELQLYVGG